MKNKLILILSIIIMLLFLVGVWHIVPLDLNAKENMEVNWNILGYMGLTYCFLNILGLIFEVSSKIKK